MSTTTPEPTSSPQTDDCADTCPRCDSPNRGSGRYECGERYVDGSYRGTCRRIGLEKPIGIDAMTPPDVTTRIEHRACTECDQQFESRRVYFTLNIGGKSSQKPVGVGPSMCQSCLTAADLERARDEAAAVNERIEWTRRQLVPKRWQHARIEQLPEKRRKWAAEYTAGGSLYLFGPPDGGKTHTLAAIVLRLVTSAEPGIAWANVPHLLDRLQQFDNDADRGLLDRLATAPRLLVLDDLGAEKITDWRMDRLYVLINRRYEACLPIAVTSNLDPDQLADHVGDRVARRVIEMCEGDQGSTFGPFPVVNRSTMGRRGE